MATASPTDDQRFEMTLGNAYQAAIRKVRIAHGDLPEPMRTALRVDYRRLELAAMGALLDDDREGLRDTIDDWCVFWMEAIELEIQNAEAAEPAEAGGPVGRAFLEAFLAPQEGAR